MKIIRKCNHCKKWFALEMHEKTLVRKEEIRILERLTQPNPKGTVETVLDHFVSGERFYYDILYVCKYCGAEEKEFICEDVKK